ncbi:MAG: dehydratase [Chloroflexi bacterium]|nr:dehydratase [Chloroflexota bacterium]
MTEQLRGKYFEEFVVGDTLTSPGRTITETDVMLFAGLSGDYNELHTNTEFSAGTPFGQRIAHGLLGLSIASGLVGRLGLIEGTAIAFTGLEWRFKAPVFIGDTIHVRAQVEKTRPMRALGGGLVILQITICNQRNETVQEGTWKVLMRARPGA